MSRITNTSEKFNSWKRYSSAKKETNKVKQFQSLSDVANSLSTNVKGVMEIFIGFQGWTGMPLMFVKCFKVFQ